MRGLKGKKGDAGLSMSVEEIYDIWYFWIRLARQIIAPCLCRMTVHAVEMIGIGTPKCVMLFRAIGSDLHMCSPSGQTCGPELTSIKTVGVQITSTQRSATLRLTRKIFVLFLMSFPCSTTNGTWGYYTRELQQPKTDISIHR